jgi:hypothetical protein
MKTSGVRAVGRLRYQWDWDSTGWYYTSRKGEQIKMKFFLGVIEYDGGSLRQIILGPLAISWGWAE